jgi:hypothetical protein
MGFGGGFAQGFTPPGWAHHAYTLYSREGAGAAAGYLGGTAISKAASGIQTLGLGQSFEGFLLSSAQKYFEVSKITTQLDRRFRESTDHVLKYGHAMGYTAAEAGSLAEALGANVNAFRGEAFSRYAGLARFAGLDPGVAMERLGRIEQLGGAGRFQAVGGAGGLFQPAALSDRDLASLVQQAQSMGMGGGRFGEFLQNIGGTMERMVQSTGRADVRSAQLVEGLTRRVFTERIVDPESGQLVTTISPLGMGQRGAAFQEQFQDVITGRQNPAMRTLMMQAMGYGRDPNLSYMQAEQKLEAGVNDPENIMNMFRLFQRRGYSQSQTYLALREAGFAPVQSRYLTQSLGTAEGLEAYAQDAARQEEVSREVEFRQQLTPEQLSKYEAGGMGALGKEFIAPGEARGVQMESLMLRFGPKMADAMFDMTDTIENLIDSLKSLTGINFGELLTDVTGAVKRLSEMLEASSQPGGAVKKVFESTQQGQALEAAKRGAWGEAAGHAALGVTPIGLISTVNGILSAYLSANAEAGAGE